MPEAVKQVIEDYRHALEDREWAIKSGILISLLRMILRVPAMEDLARATAEEVLDLEDEQRERDRQEIVQ